MIEVLSTLSVKTSVNCNAVVRTNRNANPATFTDLRIPYGTCIIDYLQDIVWACSGTFLTSSTLIGVNVNVALLDRFFLAFLFTPSEK